MTRDSKGSVLSRWSRRKLEADQLTPAVEESISPDAEVNLTLPATEEVDAVEQPVLTDADMPDIESLNEDSDFSGFMSAGVSDELRNLALRKMFHAPVFNIRDGLDEYDEDYTTFEKLGDIVTCDMKHQMEVQERKAREALEAENKALEEADLDDVEAIDDDGGTDADDADADDVDADDVDENAEVEGTADNNNKQASANPVEDEDARKTEIADE
jgi:hypothetical protein